MWPWEHVALAYVAVSLGHRAVLGRPPSARVALFAVVGGLAPDLIDKPLSWGLDLFPTGYALGHSVFFVVPVTAAAVLLGRRTGTRHAGPAALAGAAGLLTHLAGDVLDPLRRGEPPAPERLLWPLANTEPYGTELGLRRLLVYLARYPRELDSLRLESPELLVLGLPLIAVAVWIADGTPGLVWLGRALRGGTTRR